LRQTNKLSPSTVKSKKKPGWYADGGNLYLQVTEASGDEGVTKSWLFRYMLNGRARGMGLGSVKDFTLKEARERARLARQKVADGIDPIEAKLVERDQARKEQDERITFKQAVDEYIEIHSSGWKNAKHRAQWRSSLDQYAASLMSREVRNIDDRIINDALRPIWTRIPDTAKRTRGRVKMVVKWVKDGKPLPTNATENGEKQPALPYEQIGEFMRELRSREGVSALALEFQILTASRPGAVATAPWSEFDLEEKVWTVSAKRPGTKLRGQDHKVPLSDRAIEILEKLPREKHNPHAFIGRAGKSLSDMALLQTVRRMNSERKKAGLPAFVDPKQEDREIVPHGFRSTFRDWAEEQTSFPNAVTEKALAHTVGNKVEAAYRRGDLFEKRTKLMDAWEKYCEKPKAAGGNVTPIRKRA
jgi:integrase